MSALSDSRPRAGRSRSARSASAIARWSGSVPRCGLRSGEIFTGVSLDAYLGRGGLRRGRGARPGGPAAAGSASGRSSRCASGADGDRQQAAVSRAACRDSLRTRSEARSSCLDRWSRVVLRSALAAELLPPRAGADMSTPPRRLVTAERREDDVAEASLRPQRLSEFVGQEQARANLAVFIEAARARKEALDHVLFVGPPGLGKTTLAQIVARELGVNFRATSGPVIAKAGDLAALLTNLEERDVLFIDEIHRLNPAVEEILYPAMEDFQLDLIIGEGPAARSVKIDLAQFTLVGATTRAGLLTTPLRDRFGIPVRLNFYTEPELEQIVNRGARVLGIGMTPDGANEIARRARGTPRIAGRLLRRVRDFAHVADGAKPSTAARRQGAARARGRCRRPRRDGPALSLDHRRELRRRPGRRRDDRGRALGAARRHRGDHRAVPDPAGLLQRTPRGRLLTATPSATSASPSRRATRRNSDCLGRARTTGFVIAEWYVRIRKRVRPARCRHWKADATAAACASASPPTSTASRSATARSAPRRASGI